MQFPDRYFVRYFNYQYPRWQLRSFYRRIGAAGKLPPMGNTEDMAEASYRNPIGEPLLPACWKEPGFNAKERAYTSPIWYPSWGGLPGKEGLAVKRRAKQP